MSSRIVDIRRPVPAESPESGKAFGLGLVASLLSDTSSSFATVQLPACWAAVVNLILKAEEDFVSLPYPMYHQVLTTNHDDRPAARCRPCWQMRQPQVQNKHGIHSNVGRPGQISIASSWHGHVIPRLYYWFTIFAEHGRHTGSIWVHTNVVPLHL